jgi:hypothetical protein
MEMISQLQASAALTLRKHSPMPIGYEAILTAVLQKTNFFSNFPNISGVEKGLIPLIQHPLIHG